VSFPNLLERKDTGLVRVVRVGDCHRFFNLDPFGLAPIDRRMLLRQL
jgi:hypothetical protein